jgi:hypothetical protein
VAEPVFTRPVFLRLAKLTGGAGACDSVPPDQTTITGRAADMVAAPQCITCDLERTLISIQPGRNRHDVRSYECPDCKDIFRLVVPRAALEADELVFREADELVFEEPSRRAATR